MRTAPMLAQLVPKSLASPGLFAYIVTAKYVDELPLYRQHQQLRGIGMDLSRTTMAMWMVRTRSPSPLSFNPYRGNPVNVRRPPLAITPRSRPPHPL